MAFRLPTRSAHEIDRATAIAESKNPELVRSPPVGGRGKRCFDVTFAVIAIALLSPIFLLIALLIKISDGMAQAGSCSHSTFGSPSQRISTFSSPNSEFNTHTHSTAFATAGTMLGM